MEKRNCFGLTERDMKTITAILEKYPDITLIHIFGSRAKGEFKLGSDIDLAIMNDAVSETEVLKIKNNFEESNLPYNVDLVDYASLEHIELKEHIERVGQPFYKKINK